MTTLTTPNPNSASTPASEPVPAHESSPSARSGLSFAGLIHSEWIKLWSVRSTVWSFALLVVISLGIAAISAMSTNALIQSSGIPGGLGGLPAADQAGIVTQAATLGVFLGQLIVAVLGVLVISGEYRTGMITSTLAAAPRRLGALGAKVVVLFVSTLAVGLLSTIGSFIVAAPILSGQGLSVSLFDPLVFRPVLGAALYLALVAVFALGVGASLRSGAGGIAAALGILLLLPIVPAMIPGAWATSVSPYLISNAGVALFATTGMEPWQGLLIVLGWIVVAFGFATILLKRRDA